MSRPLRMPGTLPTHNLVIPCEPLASPTIVRHEALSSAASGKEGSLANRAHMILLVDDDDDVRETSADMLGELGYDVIQASNGQDALAILTQYPDLEIMVTDIRMPGMSGLELSDYARDIRKDLKVILVSGYFVPQPIMDRFLQKPFRTHELDQAIRAELAQR